MALLLLASILWLAVHIGISGTSLRARLHNPLGDNAYRGVHALLSLATFAFLIWAFRQSGAIVLWTLPKGAYHGLALLMLPVFLLFAGASSKSNPTGKRPLSPAGASGIVRITRHPMLWGITLWAIIHIIGNGELAATIFFGTFAVTALAGMPSIDRKFAARDPAGWAKLSAETSIVPFGAILTGRNRLVLSEIPRAIWIGGAVLWLVVLMGHKYVIGISPLGG